MGYPERTQVLAATRVVADKKDLYTGEFRQEVQKYLQGHMPADTNCHTTGQALKLLFKLEGVIGEFRAELQQLAATRPELMAEATSEELVEGWRQRRAAEAARKANRKPAPVSKGELLYAHSWPVENDHDSYDSCTVRLYDTKEGQRVVFTYENSVSTALLSGQAWLPDLAEDQQVDWCVNPTDENGDEDTCREIFHVGFVPGTYEAALYGELNDKLAALES